MCGISGFITSRPTTRTVQVMRGLLAANQVRGKDSTGVYLSSGRRIVKKTGPAEEFITDMPENLLYGNNLVLGHTRFATHGAIDNDNAHPFSFGDIVGVHNGVISNYKDVYPQAKVDSEAIFYALSEAGNDPKQAFTRLTGSACVAWTDGKNQLHLVRHTNPLTIAVVEKTLFFSSLDTPLFTLLYGIYGHIDFMKDLDSDKHFVFNQKLDYQEENISFKKPPIFSFPGKTSYNYGGVSNNGAWKGGGDSWKTGLSKKQKKKLEKQKKSGLVTPVEIIIPPTQEDVDDFLEIMEKDGCCYCGKRNYVHGYLDYLLTRVACFGCGAVAQDRESFFYINMKSYDDFKDGYVR